MEKTFFGVGKIGIFIIFKMKLRLNPLENVFLILGFFINFIIFVLISVFSINSLEGFGL